MEVLRIPPFKIISLFPIMFTTSRDVTITKLSSCQVINAIQSGNAGLASQLASCCCDVRTAIQQQGYENQLAIVNQTNTLTSNANTQFNILGAKIDAQTQIINDKFCQLEMREMQNKIDTLRAEGLVPNA